MPASTPTADTAAARLGPGTVLCGYRLVRRLGSEPADAVWLAHSDRLDRTVALRICRDDDVARHRVASHTRVRSPHVLSLVDVATVADGRLALASEQTDWSLATLLAARPHLSAGEAVTVLAPLTAGLAAVHSAGLVLGGLTSASVFFAADGRPVIGGFDGLRDDPITVEQADGSAPSSPGVAADYRALSALVRSIGEVVEESSRPEFVAIADWLDSSIVDPAAATSRAGQLECRIFAVAPSLPVVLVADRRVHAIEHDRGPSRPRSAIRPARRSLTGVLSAVTRVRRSLAGRVASGISGGLGPFMRRRGLPVAVAVLVAVLAVSAGLTAIPGPTEGRQPSSSHERGPEPRSNAPTPRAAPSSEEASVGLGFTARESAAVDGDDAAAAVAALLELRGRCAAAAEPACVRLFAEDGSAIDDADRHAFRSRPSSGALLVGQNSRGTVEVVQAYGDAVLTRAVPADSKRQPVLVLVVRTDTGWRLRDLFEPD